MRGKDLLRRGALTLEQRYYGNARIFREDELRGVLRGDDPSISHSDVTADPYYWARSIIDDSGTAEYLDLAAVHRMLDEHRAGPRDHSRRIWAVLIFMLWHGIFIEQRIVPVVPEPRYPVHV